MTHARALALALFSAIALSACGEPTFLTVNATAQTRTAPDLAVVTLGVLARGADARAAQQAQSERMAAVVAAARTAGIESGDIQTVGFSLEPQYAYPRNAAPRITGYVSRNVVTLRVRNLEAVSGLIDATVAQGANELHSIQFTFDDLEASHEAARAEALQTAQRRAETYAQASGKRVVAMRSITEPGSTLMPWDSRRDGFIPPMAVAAEQSARNAVNPGEIDNFANVTVVFELR
jgi:uncharacterized protein YggE